MAALLTSETAHVVGSFTRLIAPLMLVAQTVSYVASTVCDQLSAFGKESLVAPAVDACSCCKEDLKKEGKQGRPLTRMPLAITQDKTFSKKGLPLRLCVYCDGDAYEEAMLTHKDRTLEEEPTEEPTED